MLGLGWGEMLVIAVVVLIVVGPKDLPVLMRNIGRTMGSVRKMSNEFRREIDKAIAADEIREAKKALSDPLKQTTADITKEFNAIRDGKVEPSGKLKPSEPGSESVVDEIRAQAGMLPKALKPETPAASAAMQARVTERVASKAEAAKPAVPAVAASGAVVGPAAQRITAAKPKAASVKPKAPAAKPAARKTAAAKSGAGKTVMGKAGTGKAAGSTGSKSASAKPDATKSGTAKSTPTRAKPSAKARAKPTAARGSAKTVDAAPDAKAAKARKPAARRPKAEPAASAEET